MRKLIYFSYLLIGLLSSCSTLREESPLSLTWKDHGYNAKTKLYENEFIIKNISRKKVESQWIIHYSQLPREIKQVDSEDITIEALNGNFYCIRPTQHYKNLKPGDSLSVRFSVSAKPPTFRRLRKVSIGYQNNRGKPSLPL